MKTRMHEIQEFRERRHIFFDRSEAGETIGRMLQINYRGRENGIVLAIPAGGVPVGMKVRELLDLPFELMIVRKLQIPGNPEAGFGAMTLDGTTFLNQPLLSQLHVTSAEIEAEKERVRSELEKRNAVFREGRPLPDLSGNMVILVDDGLASGFTMLASVAMAKKAKARQTVVAIPTAPQRSIERILAAADEVYCPNIRTTPYFAVAEAYRNWYDLDEGEVVDLLEA